MTLNRVPSPDSILGMTSRSLECVSQEKDFELDSPCWHPSTPTAARSNKLDNTLLLPLVVLTSFLDITVHDASWKDFVVNVSVLFLGT